MSTAAIRADARESGRRRTAGSIWQQFGLVTKVQAAICRSENLSAFWFGRFLPAIDLFHCPRPELFRRPAVKGGHGRVGSLPSGLVATLFFS
jgi:hypothetical protein